jgi:putative redox protein
MDIIAILRKAQKQVDDFSMKVTGEISKHAPIEYTSIHVVYEFKGSEENKQSALNAVTDSQEKYCGISHMLKKIMPVTWEVIYNGETVLDNRTAVAVQVN